MQTDQMKQYRRQRIEHEQTEVNWGQEHISKANFKFKMLLSNQVSYLLNVKQIILLILVSSALITYQRRCQEIWHPFKN